MFSHDTVEMLAFNLKMMGRRSRKNILVSAGGHSDKERLLPHLQALAKLNVDLFATSGTSAFLATHDTPTTEIYKIKEKREPNIESFLRSDRFDLVINILHGVPSYDESSDSRLIRTLSIEAGIPLITDAEVAIATIKRMCAQVAEQRSPLTVMGEAQPWNMKLHFARMVQEMGGLANYHGHFDKAYLISPDNLKLGQVDMQKKWALYKYLKENYTHEDLVQRISRAVEGMIAQGVTHTRTMVDADSTVKLLPVKAALEVKERYKDQICFEIGVQPLQGVLEPESRKAFIEACSLADLVGGLPSKDRPTPEKHLDFILALARDLGKCVDVHVDQENNPWESETELLAIKTMEYGMEGRVSGVHGISVAAKPEPEQERILAKVKDAGMNIIICPSAAISMKQLPATAPLHNSIAPLAKLIEAEIPLYMGVDNIYDLFMPMVDGDMWFECRMLMESCRFYDLEAVARMACDKTGFSTAQG